MPKFTFVLVIVALAVVQGLPAMGDDDVASAAAAGNWEKVHEILSKTFHHDFKFGPFPIGNVRELKPQQGGHVYGESDYNFKSASNYNGKLEQNSGGHHVINLDGTVREYDYKPKF